ncbi:unnamed protein product [Penicillium glandicola]
MNLEDLTQLRTRLAERAHRRSQILQETWSIMRLVRRSAHENANNEQRLAVDTIRSLQTQIRVLSCRIDSLRLEEICDRERERAIWGRL